MTEAVQTINALERKLPPEFWSLTEDVDGTKARLIEFQGQRQAARISPAGSPPRPRGKLSLNEKAIILLSSTEEMEFSEELQNILQDWESYTPQQNWAERNIAYQGEGFRQIFENLETASAYLNLANAGILYFDGNGNLLPSSSGATLTVDQGVPANNTGQLNSLLTGSFADSTFDIPTFLTQKLKPRSLGDTGYALEIAVYGANIPGYLANNQFTKLAWAYQAEYASYYMNTGRIKDGYLGFKWIPAAEAYWVDKDGTTRFPMPADQITFGPAMTKAHWTMYIGSTRITTQYGPFPDVEGALRQGTGVVKGRWRVAYIPQGPVTKIIDAAGSKFLHRIKVPGAWYFLDTTP